MSRTPQEEANLALVLEMFAQVLGPMDSGAVERFIAPGYIQHNQAVEPGRESLKAFLDTIRAQTPQAVHDVAPDAPVYFPYTADNHFLQEIERLGHRIVGEIYPDLRYDANGTPIVERAKHASSPEEVAEQVALFIQTGKVRTIDGELIELRADSVCLHGDDPNGPACAEAVRRVMVENDCELGLVDAGVTA